LSEFLRESIILEANQAALTSNIFSKNFSENFLAKISKKFRETAFQPN
jgi:hypothetical protein